MIKNSFPVTNLEVCFDMPERSNIHSRDTIRKGNNLIKSIDCKIDWYHNCIDSSIYDG